MISYPFKLNSESFFDGLHYMTVNLESSTGSRANNSILSGQLFATFDGKLFPNQFTWKIKNIVSVGRYGNDLSNVWLMVQVEPSFERKKKLTKKELSDFYANTKEGQRIDSN